MKKHKNSIIGLLVFLVIIGGIVGFRQYRKYQAEEEARQKEERILEALKEYEEGKIMQERSTIFATQANAFGINYTRDYDFEFTYGKINGGKLYLRLYLYKRETGIELTFDDIIEYTSQTKEDDGTDRFYTNGRNPKIQAYVEWFDEIGYQDFCRPYIRNLNSFMSGYKKENPESMFDGKVATEYNKEQMEEAIRLYEEHLAQQEPKQEQEETDEKT